MSEGESMYLVVGRRDLNPGPDDYESLLVSIHRLLQFVINYYY